MFLNLELNLRQLFDLKFTFFYLINVGKNMLVDITFSSAFGEQKFSHLLSFLHRQGSMFELSFNLGSRDRVASSQLEVSFLSGVTPFFGGKL